MQPIQVGYLMKYLQEEEDGLTSLLSASGAHISTAYIPDLVRDEYQEKAHEVRKAVQEYRDLKLSGDRKAVLDYYRKNKKLIRLHGRLNKIKKVLTALRKRAKRIELSVKLSAEEKKRRLKVINKRMKQAMEKFNKLYENEVGNS
jgi:hypothetical protein